MPFGGVGEGIEDRGEILVCLKYVSIESVESLAIPMARVLL